MDKDVVLISDEKIIRGFYAFLGNRLIMKSSEPLNCPIPTQIFTEHFGGQKGDEPVYFGCLILLTTKHDIYEKFMDEINVWKKSLDPAMERSMGSKMEGGCIG